MSYAGYLLATPHSWGALMGIGVGVAASALTRRSSRTADPERSRSRKSSVAYVALAVAAAAAAGGTLFPPARAAFTLPVASTAAAAFVLAFIATRFPRSLGIPILFLISLVAFATVELVKPWVAVRGSSELGSVEVLTFDGERMRLEVDVSTPDRRTEFVELPGSELSATVARLRVSDHLFFVGTPYLMATEAISADAVSHQFQPRGATAIGTRVEDLLLKTALLERDAVETNRIRVNVLRSYAVTANPDGSVRFGR